jgi:uncharacterized protein YndB with AHSA1/START domain
MTKKTESAPARAMKTTEILKVTMPSDREIAMTRVFDGSHSMIFDALTKPELLKLWLLGPPDWSMVVCEIDLKVGGRPRYVWRKADGLEMGLGGGYREIVPPERIVLTELFDIDWTGGETLNTVIFTEHNGKTTLTNTVGYSSREGRDGALIRATHRAWLRATTDLQNC